jgi:hypothetical protein
MGSHQQGQEWACQECVCVCACVTFAKVVVSSSLQPLFCIHEIVLVDTWAQAALVPLTACLSGCHRHVHAAWAEDGCASLCGVADQHQVAVVQVVMIPRDWLAGFNGGAVTTGNWQRDRGHAVMPAGEVLRCA